MEYAETDPPPALRRHVQCLWRLRDATPSAAPQTVYPDGRCELIVHLAVPMEIDGAETGWRTQSRTLFAAQSHRAIRLRAAGALDCLGARLQPAASALLLPAPVGARVATAAPVLAALADQVHDLQRLNAPLAFALQRDLGANANAGHAAFSALLGASLAGRPIDVAIERACALLDRSEGDVAIAVLAEQLGLGQRALQMRFLAAVGMTPKAYARVRRLQATIKQLDGGRASLAETALAAGFADQAHATRALRHFSGLTPARLRHALQAERDGDRTMAMAAAFVRGGSLAPWD